MDSYGPAGKRLRPDTALNGNGGVAGSKRFKKEMESFPTGIGSKSKPCTKFFSTAGCPFGEGCHFLHYVPGGINAVSQMSNVPNPAHHPARNQGPPSVPNSGSAPGLKTRMCNKYNSAEGCKYGDKCHFAHGERELGKPAVSGHDDRPYPPPMGGRMPPGGGRVEPPPPGLGAAASFGASATAKISVDASLAGAIIGKGGVNSKQICRMTGVKLSIREHEADANLRNIELEGTFDQIKQASAMVRELIVNIGSAAAAAAATGGPPTKNHHPGGGPPPGGHGGAASNFKTKLCENFAKGSCTFGERCHFAHGANELRKAGLV